MANISDKIQQLLIDRASVSYNNITNTITIKPPPINKFCTGYFLEHIRDVKWNDILIDNTIKINLDGWLIDIDDNNFGGDLWCLKWMKDNYNIIDNCDRWREGYSEYK